MAASKSLHALGLLAATLALFLLSFEMATARELADTTEHKTVKEAADAGAKDQKQPDQYGGYPGGGYGGYPGGGYGGYPGRGGGYGSYPRQGGGYPGRGGGYGGYPGPGGGYPGHGGGHYCRWGCCRRGYHGCQCCSFKGEVPDAELQAEPGN